MPNFIIQIDPLEKNKKEIHQNSLPSILLNRMVFPHLVFSNADHPCLI